jgi:nucleoid-associated protein YgaU
MGRNRAQQPTSHRTARPPGAWRRFWASVLALVVVLVGVPLLLAACARAGLDAWHPLPGIGSTDDITGFFQRDLTPTEIAPVALRALLIVAWLLWLAMALSVVSAIFEARGSALRSWIPQFAMFAGLGRWIAAGITAVSSLAPTFVSSAALASPRPFTVSSITPELPVEVERPVAPGFARVQRGESVETFAQRVLGDAARWPEVWQLNKQAAVGPDGETWSAAWKLGAGWDLRLPADAVPVQVPAMAPVPTAVRAERHPLLEPAAPSAWARPENLTVVKEYEVIAGDSFWGIAERFLPDGAGEHDVWEFTQALMAFNAPRLGYDHPAMLQPGDIVDIVAPQSEQSAAAAAPTVVEPEHDQATEHAVVAGDSYWAIAEQTLGTDAPPAAVLELTEDLIERNSPRLRYDDPHLIHPGDIVYVTDPALADPVPAPTSVLTSDVDAIAIDELPPTPLPPPDPATVTTMTSSTTTTTSSTTLPPPAEPDVSDDVAGDERSGPSSPIGIGQAALIATGVVALLAARRRAKLRAAEPPARIPLPHPDMAATERRLRQLEAGERLLRVDIVLRAAAAGLADADRRIVVVRSAPDGTVEILADASVTLGPPWVGSDRRWAVPGDVPIEQLAVEARTVGAPCVAITQIGVDEDGWDVLVDLESLGLLAIAGDPAANDRVVRALAVGLASSEFAEVAHLIGVGIDEAAFLGHRHAHVVPTVDEAIELAATLVGTAATSTRTTFSLRARRTSGEMWEPALIVVAAGQASEVTSAVTASVSTRGGLGIVVGAPLADAPWTLRPDGAAWLLDPLGLRLTPVGLDAAELDELDELFQVLERGAVEDTAPEGESPSAAGSPVAAESYAHNGNGHRGDGHNGHEPATTSPAAAMLQADLADVDGDPGEVPPWSLMVRVLGAVEVVDGELSAVKFERSKTLELVAWIVTHRQRASRSAARTALWELDVRDATFANVVSEARRLMARHLAPPEGDEWLRRTMTDELSLHDEVVADFDVVRRCVERAKAVSGSEAMAVLRPAVELVRELPFAGTGYLWPDAEGITSSLVLLATNVSAEYGKLALAAGDAEGVFWATGRGLQVLPGQEALIALRMQTHAEAGDLSGVRLEWESYERVINSDPWSDGEPAPKLVALRQELLSR